MKCLSIVYPSGTKIALGEKTIEVRSWKPNIGPNEDLLIVENRKFLRVDGETDIGKPIAIARIKAVRDFKESDVPLASASRWEPGYYSWELEKVVHIQSNLSVLADRGIYDVDFKFERNMSEPEKNDFYVDKQWLASYFEKDWMDKLIEQGADKNLKFHFPQFNSSNLYSSYHERFVSLIRSASDKVSAKPTSVLEIGSSLGRTFYEIAKSFSSVENAVLVEPSENLENTFKKIFLSEKLNQFPTLSKYKNIEDVSFDSSKIRNSCAHIHLEVLNEKYDELSGLGLFDLVVCSNVIDQCESPNSLVQMLKDKVSPNGLLAISCTYQWNDKYFKSNDEQITDIKDLFDNEWLLLGEDEIEFRCRRNERHWLTFMSHAIVLQKKTLF